MARPYLCLLFTVLIPSAGVALNLAPPIGGRHIEQVEKLKGGESRLRVDGKVREQSFCGGGPKLFSVTMKVGLRFTNLSKRPLILARNVQGPIAIRVAKDPEALRAGRFEYNPSLDSAVAKLPDSPQFGNIPNLEYLCILPPGEVFKTQISAVIFGSQTGKKGLVGKGKHVLQLGLEVWPYQWPWHKPIDAAQLADRWKEYGQLITGNIFTEPIPFTVPARATVVPCE
jgi:hypothetical protein